MIAQILRYLARILDVAFNTKRKRLDALQQQETIERRQGGAGVSLAHGPAAGNISGIAVVVDVDYAVVGNFWPVQHVEALGILAPWKLSTVDNHSAQGCAVSSHEFRHGMHNHIGAIFDRPQQDWRGD